MKEGKGERLEEGKRVDIGGRAKEREKEGGHWREGDGGRTLERGRWRDDIGEREEGEYWREGEAGRTLVKGRRREDIEETEKKGGGVDIGERGRVRDRHRELERGVQTGEEQASEAKR